MNTKTSFDFILKPVGELCNFACTYCYYSPNERTHSKREMWSHEFAQKVLLSIATFEKQRGNTKASVTWHGGEALFLGLDWYQRIIAYQATLPVHFANTFQTNGSLLTRDWVKFLKENNMTVGISIDGPEKVHNIHRKQRNGKGTFQETFNAIRLCQDHDVNFGALCVITNENAIYVDEILNFFVDNRIFDFDFLPSFALQGVIGEQATKININSATLTQFMKKVFDWYLRKNDPHIHIRAIASLVERIIGGTGGVCTIGGDVCGSYLTIEADGDIVFCDDYHANIFPNFGNVLYQTIGEVVNGKHFQSISDNALERLQNCKNCSVFDICGGGCPRYWNNHQSYFCDHYREFYSYAQDALRNILQSVTGEKFAQE